MRRPRATGEMEWRLESALTRPRSLKRSAVEEGGGERGDRGGRNMANAPLRPFVVQFPFETMIGISMDLPGGRRGIQTSSKFPLEAYLQV